MLVFMVQEDAHHVHAPLGKATGPVLNIAACHEHVPMYVGFRVLGFRV